MPDSSEPCPECGAGGQQITTDTVRNMVEPFENQDIEDGVQYRICKKQDCPVVYFADELNQQFEGDVIRARPNFKLGTDTKPYPLCYCFGYTKEHVRQDIAENGETEIDDWITERVQSKECACQWKSPLGGCCLGNVRDAIAEAREDLAR